MKFFDAIIEIAFGISIKYLQWMADSTIDQFNLSHLSLVIICAWMLLFLLWFIKQVLQPAEESRSDHYLQFLRGFVINCLLLFFFSIIIAAFIVYNQTTDLQWLKQWSIQYLGKPVGLTFLFLGLISLIIGWLSVRYWLPTINYWLNERITKKGYQESGISDIRDIDQLIPKTVDYEPSKFWKRKQEKIFIGLDPTFKPIHIPLAEWKSQHQQVLGTTGFGKGVAVTNQLCQCLNFNQTVVVFDPKHDEWAPSVLIQTAKHLGFPVCIIDLNANQPQFNPLYGTDDFELFDLMVGAFGLAEKGAESDYYRSKERRVVQKKDQSAESRCFINGVCSFVNRR